MLCVILTENQYKMTTATARLGRLIFSKKIRSLRKSCRRRLQQQPSKENLNSRDDAHKERVENTCSGFFCAFLLVSMAAKNEDDAVSLLARAEVEDSEEGFEMQRARDDDAEGLLAAAPNEGNAAICSADDAAACKLHRRYHSSPGSPTLQL